jgi:hypothetical protein
VDWCRIKEVKPSGVDEDSPAFNKIAREIEGASDWIRTDRVSPEDADLIPTSARLNRSQYLVENL